jgi:hypothetical protein
MALARIIRFYPSGGQSSAYHLIMAVVLLIIPANAMDKLKGERLAAKSNATKAVKQTRNWT